MASTTTRRGNREATREKGVYPVSGGRWRAKWREPDGTQASETFGDLGSANAKVRSVRTAKESGRYRTAARVTVSEWWDEYTAVMEGSGAWRDGTAKLYRRTRATLPDRWGALALGRLDKAMIRRWLAGLDGDLAELSPRTRAVHLARLQAVLGRAVTDELLDRNPAAGLRGELFAKAEKGEPFQVLSDTELARLSGALPDRLRVLITLCAELGLRSGEVRALRVSDVDRSRMFLRVKRQVVKLSDGTFSLDAKVKSGNSSREVPMTDAALSAIDAHIRQFVSGGADGSEDGESDPLLLPGRSGRGQGVQVLDGSVLTAIVRRAGVKVGLHVGPHDLRHRAASHWFALGVPLAQVAASLGDDQATVLRTYSHVMPGGADAMRAALSRSAAIVPIAPEPAPVVAIGSAPSSRARAV